MASYLINEMKSTYRFSDLGSEPLRILPSIENYEQIPIVSLEESIQPIICLIPNIEHMIWIIKQNYQQQIEDELTFDESASIMLYSMEWIPIENSVYYLFNQTLRKENRDLLKPWLLYFKLLLTSHSKLPTINNLTVYRGIHMNLSSKYIKGQTLIWWGFSSCTTSDEYLTNFLNEKGLKTLFKIDCQTGKSIHQYTLFPEHQDILLLPERQFQVIDNYQEDEDLYIIHLKEISEKKNLINKHFKFHGEMKLNKLKLNDFDIDMISKQTINNKNCIELSLNDNQITSKGALILASVLYNNTKLKKLVLANNSIGDLGVSYLSKILETNHTNLRTFDLSSNHITYKGIEYIADMLKTNQILTSLWLNGNAIDHQGINLLMDVLIHYNTTLKFLRLSSDQTINDISINSIISMIEYNKTLNYLDLQNCNISLNGKKLLEEAIKTKKHFYLDI